MPTSTSVEARTAHPLDPLTAEEISVAIALLRKERSLAEDVLFVRVTLHEPPKDIVLGFRPEDPIDRQAFIIIRDRGALATFEAVV
jgi:primary-amine oxidase